MPIPSKSKLFLSFAVVVALLVFPVAAQATMAYVKYARYPFAPLVFTADDDGFDDIPIGPGTDPKVSPDGELVAYISDGIVPGHQRLKVSAVYGGVSNLLIDAHAIISVTWSPESNRVAAVRRSWGGSEKLVLIDVATGGEHVVARGRFGGVSFSPEGDQLVFSRARRGEPRSHSDIFRAAVGGHGARRLTYDHRSYAPVWGPGERVAFVKRVGKRRKIEIFLMKPDGGEVRRLTHTRFARRRQGLYPIDWSPDGSRLLANFSVSRQHSAPRSKFGVVVDPRSGALGRLRKRKARFVGTAFSCDGARVLGSSGGFHPLSNHKVGVVPAASGPMHVLVQFAYEPDWGGC